MDLSGIVKVRYGEYNEETTDNNSVVETPVEQPKTEPAETAPETKPSVYSLICMELGKRGISDNDTIMKFYIDSKLESVVEDGVAVFVAGKLGEKIEDSTPDEEIVKIENALKEKGYECKVSRYKIKRVKPCIRVEAEKNIDDIRNIMTELGYTYKSKYKGSYYFV